MVVNQVLLLLLKPQPYVPAKTFATNCTVAGTVASLIETLGAYRLPMGPECAMFAIYAEPENAVKSCRLALLPMTPVLVLLSWPTEHSSCGPRVYNFALEKGRSPAARD